jgi:tRNA threonylcarbamoyladenosine biosynthesis protein TsaB
MLLAIDTSTAQVGLALYDGTRIPGELSWQSRLHHSQELAPALADLLRRTGLTIKEVQALGVAIGPGSFTSLRVGLAFAKGLALARHLPLIGIPTLDVVAAAVPICSPNFPPTEEAAAKPVRLAAVLQAGRGRLAVGWYKVSGDAWQSEGPASVMTADELSAKIHQRTIICGELTADERQHLKRKFKNVSLASLAECVRRPGLLAELAWNRWQAGKIDPAASLAPIYLHVAGGPPA